MTDVRGGLEEVSIQFKPKPDITVYELAVLWEHVGLRLSRGMYDSMPPEVKRHFGGEMERRVGVHGNSQNATLRSDDE